VQNGAPNRIPSIVLPRCSTRIVGKKLERNGVEEGWNQVQHMAHEDEKRKDERCLLEKRRREVRGERREARGERREARDERREARGERREARGERREARGERRDRCRRERTKRKEREAEKHTRTQEDRRVRRVKGEEKEGENRVGEAPKLELIGGGRIAGTNVEGRPQRKRPSGDVTLIPPGRAYKMAAGVPFLPCYSYGVGFRLSKSLCLRGLYMREYGAAAGWRWRGGVRKSMHLEGTTRGCGSLV